MIVVIDTSVLSLAFRRRDSGSQSQSESNLVSATRRLALLRIAVIIGMVRQEILSGVKSSRQFEQLQTILDGFVFLAAEQADYDTAAESFNVCRSRGIAAGDVDMLVCAMAIRRKALILTADNDFSRYAKVLPITLYDPV